MTEILFGERSPVAVRMEAPGDGDKHHHQQCVNLPIEHKATAVITQQAGNVRRRTRQQEADTLHKRHQSPRRRRVRNMVECQHQTQRECTAQPQAGKQYPQPRQRLRQVDKADETCQLHDQRQQQQRTAVRSARQGGQQQRPRDLAEGHQRQ